MKLSQYRLEPLRKDREFVLYRGLPQTEAAARPRSILVLSPITEHPAPASVKKIEYEFSLKDNLDPAWAIRPIALTQQQSRTMLWFEDPDAEPLDRLAASPLELRQFLRFAIALAASIGHVHKRGIIHKDIKPPNVLANAAMDRAWLTGFGIASRLPRERRSAEPPELIAGTLAYMAPEQTGRMNRSVDTRSDLYAFGVTLYELLTGSLPFGASDPMEWVHCHIARQPLPPAERLRNIPRCVSAIIIKLLAKTPEERYQTAAGVESDLHRCLEDWDRGRSVHDFALGQRDRPDGLVISEKLYGRERDVGTLLDSFERVVRGGRPELVLVSGYSGIGKSSVVNELHKALVPPRGLFASGKFDQYKRDIPYATLAQAFQSLIRPILAQNEEELGRWRDALGEALGPNGQLMVDLVPELKLVIGEQRPVPELSPQDAQSRFQLVFRRFVGAFTREHPLALFLDDLQWLDMATLDLMEDLLTHPDVKSLLLIGAYRDNEVAPSHPLMRKLWAVRQAGATLHNIVLTPLTRYDLEQLIADSLHCEREHAGPLAELVEQKTAGNPFFAIQFILALFEEGLLIFDHMEGRWRWDLNRIHAKGYTDNVGDLMVGKLNRLPTQTQKALQQLACLGNSADFAMLCMVYQDSDEEMHGQLWEAVRTGLIFRSEDSYSFLHDRVQEAAYSLIPHELRAEQHLRIGSLMASHASPEKLEEGIFEIVSQLNRGSHLIMSIEERERVAELNLMAGRRAKTSTAYASALRHLYSGRGLLTDETWKRNHDLIFSIEHLLAECELLTADMSAAENRLSMLAERAKTAHETALVTRSRLTLYNLLDRSDRGVEVFIEYQRGRGKDWSPRPTDEEVSREYDQIWSLLGTRQIGELVDLPVVSDPDLLDVLDVFTEIVMPAMFADENLFALVVCRMVSLSLEHGNSDASCFGYVSLGMLAGPRFGNYDAGFQLGKLGYDLVEKHALHRYRARVYLRFGNCVMPWRHHVKTGRELVRRAFDVATRMGDFTFALFTWFHLNTNLLAAGDPLAEVQREAETGLEFAEKARSGRVRAQIMAQLALVRTLRGLTTKFGSFGDGHFDELQFESHLSSNPTLATPECRYWIRKLQGRYSAGDYSSAIQASVNAKRLLWTSHSYFEVAEYHFYGALARAGAFDSARENSRREHCEALADHHRQLAIWAANCPENFENRAALVGAEIARIEGRDLDAMRLYEKAIQSSRTNGFVHNEAVADELAGRYYLARNIEAAGYMYLRNARNCYERWGADGKVRQLDQLYPDLKQEQPMSGPTSTITAPVEGLDLATLIRVSQAVSSEIVLEKLFDTVMHNAMEHAGADRGLLIFQQRGQLQVKAEAATIGDRVAVRTVEAPISRWDLPESVLRYVMRTRESLIIADASVPTSFSDEYLREKRPRSVACVPLVKQGNLIAILYLENKLVSNVFSPARLKILEVLASQAAISLENSRLYHEIQQAEEAVRRSEKQLRDVIETMPVMAFTALPDGSTDFVNRRFSDFTGLTGGAASPHRGTTLHPEDLGTHARKWQTCLATGEAFESEVRYRGKDGQYRWFLVRSSPLRDEQGNVLKWFGSLTDIEDRKQAEERLRNENVVLREEIDTGAMFDEIVGSSAALQAVLAKVAKVAPTDSTGLITGETGTGKELIARAIHKRSRRSGRPFVSVNCAALAPTLIAAELFGHEKGAFTGATQRRLGRFELANGGTLFLDEIGELPPDVQVTLLRVLQEREFERIGGSQSVRVDVRVIAATNRDLKTAIANGTFRSDLFYRLDVFPIEVPPLRDRRDDILMLVEYFVQRYAARMAKKIHSVDKKTLHLLQSYDWPGNIRELTNIIERSVILASGDVLSVDEMWLRKQTPVSASRVEISPILKVDGGRSEREIIEAALAETRGRVSGPSGAAAKLHIPASTLASRIKALKINRQLFKFG